MKKREIKIIDQGLTTRCNLRCKFCNRQLFDYHPKKTDISIDVLRKIYTPDFVDQLKKVIICGSWGDPIFYPNLEEFLDLLDNKFTISTNANMKNSKWWYEFGKKYNGNVTFAIDGVKTYSKYRIGGSFQKAFRHMESFINGGGTASWQYILFRYNEGEDYEKAKELAKKTGVKIDMRFSHTYTDEYQKPEYFEEQRIKRPWCMVPNRHQISIDTFGDVTPCCHTRPSKLMRQQNFDNYLFAKYIKDRKNINLYYSTLENILNSEFFNYFIRNYKTLSVCQRSCGWRKWVKE